MAIVTAEKAANSAWLNIAVDTAGPAFADLVDYVNEYIRQKCGRQFDKERLTEYHDIVRQEIGDLWVRNPPIITVHSLTDDANTDTITNRSNRSISLTADIQLSEDKSFLRLVNNEGYFSTGTAAAKIAYTGGYAEKDMPKDLVAAACMIVAAWWEGAEPLVRTAQNIDGQAISWRTDEIPPQAKAILQRYKRPVF